MGHIAEAIPASSRPVDTGIAAFHYSRIVKLLPEKLMAAKPSPIYEAGAIPSKLLEIGADKPTIITRVWRLLPKSVNKDRLDRLKWDAG